MAKNGVELFRVSFRLESQEALNAQSVGKGCSLHVGKAVVVAGSEVFGNQP